MVLIDKILGFKQLSSDGGVLISAGILVALNHVMNKALKVGLFAGITSLLTSGVFGQTSTSYVFTENSDSSLTVSVNGGTAVSVSGGSDLWNYDTGIAVLSATGDSFWAEPGSSTKANEVEAIPIPTTANATGFDLFIFINSDSTLGGPGITPPPINRNGDIDGNYSYLDPKGGMHSFSVTFNDNGDSGSSVPESSSTLGLLASSVMGLLGLSQRRVWGPARA